MTDNGTTEKREAFRFKHSAPVRYRFAKKIAPGKYKISPFFKGLGIDFSGTGAAFRAGKPLPKGTLTLLEIDFPFSDDPVIATAEVVRKVEDGFKGKKVIKVMVNFIIMEENTRNKMMSFIISQGKSV